MLVHVVCEDYATSDMIIARMARALAEVNGWSIDAGPSSGADLNHWACYIHYAKEHRDWCKTPASAYFTHHETALEIKRDWWADAVSSVDLRLTSARQYLNILQAHGTARLVRPPLDREAFCPGPERPCGDPPVVGLSGFVNRLTDVRKGKWLVRELAASPLAGKIQLVATGGGWGPVPSSRRSVSQLPAFYQGLDVFLCTSEVEGVPMPPLEALACGVPVVVPRGVGLLDELPDAPGVYRYPAGDFEAMCAALEAACFGGQAVDREALRALTEPYTVENWAADHRRIFENFLYNASPVHRPATDSPCGVFYVAFGEPSRRCAVESARSFKAHMPGLPVAIASDSPTEAEDVFVQCEDADIGGRAAKTRIYDLAPAEWQRVLYLDADTEIVAPVGFLFELLSDGWDMAICTNPGRFRSTRHMVRPDNADECEVTYRVMGTDDAIQYNGGVFAFQRNERTARFFRAWHEEWQRWGKRDQAALLRALWRYPLRLYLLTNHWNTVLDPQGRTRAEFSVGRGMTAGILHFPMRARRYGGIIEGRNDSPEAWAVVEKWKGK